MKQGSATSDSKWTLLATSAEAKHTVRRLCDHKIRVCFNADGHHGVDASGRVSLGVVVHVR